MRVGIVAIDSRGGIQPYVTLGLGLQAAGHDVHLLVPKDATAWVNGLGLRATPLSADMREGARLAAETGMGAGRVVPRGVKEQMVEASRLQAAEMLDGARDADLLAGGVGGSVLGVDVAEALGIPFVPAHLQPVGTPTSRLPGVLAPWIPTGLGRVGNRIGQVITEAALTLPFRPISATVRRDVLGLPTRRRALDPDTPRLYGFSRHVVPRPVDWPRTCAVTGYWFLEADPAWTPPATLVDFLQAGPPPVSIGFGSMLGNDAERLTETVVAAVRRAGVRAILLSGWGGLRSIGGDDLLVLEEAPHSWLFPKVAAVVHHGGAGTTAAAIRAGVPSVVVPFAVDQPFWGARVASLGVAPPPLSVGRLTTDDLADALRTATSDVAMRRRAAALGSLVDAETGVADAVRILEAFGRTRGVS